MTFLHEETIQLSVVLPCLNEEAAVGHCIDMVKTFFKRQGISGEVIVADNGSSDGSAEKAVSHGAIVVKERRRGYGYAIRKGLKHSRGSVIIIADADATYDLLHLERLYRPLAAGSAEVVIGNRFRGGMEEGSMPLSHFIGVKLLSALGNLRFGTNIKDFHCGLRGIRRSAVSLLHFQTSGMEFATEFIALSKKAGLNIIEVPVSLRRSRYDRTSKLRTIKDGLRHLKYIGTQRSLKCFEKQDVSK